MTAEPILKTSLGKLFQRDCLEVLRGMEPESVDLVFADPPFNLGKLYSSGIDDAKKESDYLEWCQAWLDGCVRVLAPGGSLWLWNLPKWNLPLGAYLREKLTFRHWIAVDIKYSLPIRKRLYPSHYSLLYFIKGDKARCFHPDRIPVPCCRHCGGEIPDYGGHKDKMNPGGVNLSDVWTDLSPVRHKEYKHREGNALPLQLLDRVLSAASDPGDRVFDPFGGSGTTFVAAEFLGRRWTGCDLDCSAILERFKNPKRDEAHLKKIQANRNVLFTKADRARRRKKGLTPLSKDYRVEGQGWEGESDGDAGQPDLFSLAAS